MSREPQTCLIDECEKRPRPLPDPIPEGTEVMLTEMVTGTALYCQRHFDEAGLADE